MLRKKNCCTREPVVAAVGRNADCHVHLESFHGWAVKLSLLHFRGRRIATVHLWEAQTGGNDSHCHPLVVNAAFLPFISLSSSGSAFAGHAFHTQICHMGPFRLQS